MAVVGRAPDLERRVSSLPSPPATAICTTAIDHSAPVRGGRLPSYGLTEPIYDLTASPSTVRRRRRLVAGDGPQGLTRRSHVDPGTVHQADLRTEASAAPASAFACQLSPRSSDTGSRWPNARSCLRRAQHPCTEQHRDDRRQCHAIPDEHRDAVLGHESQQPGD